MPYTRQDVINTYRQQFPQLKPLNDNDVWRVASVNDPELAKGIEELTTPPPSTAPNKKELPATSQGTHPMLSPAVNVGFQAGMNVIDLLRGKRTEPSIMSEGAASTLRGAARPITGIPGMVRGMAATPYGGPLVTSAIGLTQGLGTARDVLANYFGVGKGAVELAAPGAVNAPTPESQVYERAQETSGELLTTLEAPNALAGAARGASALNQALGSPTQKLSAFLAKHKMNPQQINQWIQATDKDLRHGANPGAQIQKENLLGATKVETQQKVSAALQDAGQKLGAKLKAASSQRIDGESIFADAMNKASKAARGSDEAFQNSLLRVVDNAAKQFPDMKALTPERAHAFKVWIGESTKFEGASALDAQLNDVLLNTYGGINDAIKSKVPGAAADQARWQSLYKANGALDRAIRSDARGAGTGVKAPTLGRKVAKGAKYAAEGAIGAKAVYEVYQAAKRKD